MSTTDDLDVSHTLKAKSDQLNASDLMGGPITVQILGGKMSSDEKQPLTLQISGGHMGWRPCKNMRRLLSAVWGTPKARLWFGRWVTLYRDPAVTYGKDEVGGIRISAVSHIKEPTKVTVAERRGVNRTYTIEVLRAPETQGAPTADLDALLAEVVLTREDVDRWLAAKEKPLLAARTPEKVAELAAFLGANPKQIDAIRALIPSDTSDEFGS